MLREYNTYLIILVHGINTPGWTWLGGKDQGDKADNGSNVKEINNDYRGFGDLLGYLRNNLGLDGYIYYFTFSQRDGDIPLTARELGDPAYDNPAVNGGLLRNRECEQGLRLKEFFKRKESGKLIGLLG